MNKQKGFSQIVVMVIMLILAIALPITTKLVQKSQENRSKAAIDPKIVVSACTLACKTSVNGIVGLSGPVGWLGGAVFNPANNCQPLCEKLVPFGCVGYNVLSPITKTSCYINCSILVPGVGLDLICLPVCRSIVDAFKCASTTPTPTTCTSTDGRTIQNNTTFCQSATNTRVYVCEAGKIEYRGLDCATTGKICDRGTCITPTCSYGSTSDHRSDGIVAINGTITGKYTLITSKPFWLDENTTVASKTYKCTSSGWIVSTSTSSTCCPNGELTCSQVGGYTRVCEVQQGFLEAYLPVSGSLTCSNGGVCKYGPVYKRSSQTCVSGKYQCVAATSSDVTSSTVVYSSLSSCQGSCTTGTTNQTLYYYDPVSFTCKSTTSYSTLETCNTANRAACYTTENGCKTKVSECTSYKSGSKCQLTSTTCNNGSYVIGKCPGDATIRCCVPSTTTTLPGVGQKCGSNGECINTTSTALEGSVCTIPSQNIPGTLKFGLCSGGTSVRCCQSTSSCTTAGSTVCDGTSKIKTCTKDSTSGVMGYVTSSCSSGQVCSVVSGVAKCVLTTTATPTVRPTATPTVRPTATPTVRPTATPTSAPICVNGTKECVSTMQARECVNNNWVLSNCNSSQYCLEGVCQVKTLADSIVNLKIAFAGVKPGSDQCAVNWSTTVRMVDSQGQNVLSTGLIRGVPQKTAAVNAKGEVVYNLTATIKEVPENGVGGLAYFVTGLKHLPLKYGIDNQTSWYQTYVGQLRIDSGINNYDFSRYSLLAGDVTGDQVGVPDGKIDGRDYSFIKELANSDTVIETAPGNNLVGDLDGNCKVNAGDVGLIKISLREIYGQTY